MKPCLEEWQQKERKEMKDTTFLGLTTHNMQEDHYTHHLHFRCLFVDNNLLGEQLFTEQQKF